MNTGRLIQLRSSADDRALAQGLKEELRMDVGYYEMSRGRSKGLKRKGSGMRPREDPAKTLKWNNVSQASTKSSQEK